MTIDSNRTIGGVGACLSVLSVVSSIISLVTYSNPASLTQNLALAGVSSLIGVIGFVGWILFLVAMYGFSRDYGEHRIFSHVLWGIIITIVAAIVVFALWFALVFVNLFSSIPNLGSNPSSADIQSYLGPYLSPLSAIIGFVSLIYTVFVVRAFNLLAGKSTVPLFKTGAKLLLAGSLITVALGIVLAVFLASGQATFESFTLIAVPGGIVQGIAWALVAKAYFSIKSPPPQTVTSPPPQYAQVRYCTNCGAQNQPDSIYCTQCGQKL